MKKARKEDKELVIAILSKSFLTNQSVKYIVGQGKGAEKKIVALMDYSFEICYRFGEVFLTDDDTGCALLLYPQNKRTDILSIWLDIRLVLQAIGIHRISKAINREKLIKAKQPPIPMAYLWFIGVDPAVQRNGTGTALLKEIMLHARSQHLPVYLETSTERNVPWYEKYGFAVYDQLDRGYKLLFLKYELNL